MKLVTIFGGSGFIGRYITRRLAMDGWRVRVACRRPDEALFVRTYGVVGQVEPIFCNIRDDARVCEVLHGADAAIYCVGILAEHGRQTFDAVHVQGAERVARLAAEAGVRSFVHFSAIGADPRAASGYARSKAAGEAAVLRQVPEAVLLRPSLVFGPEDEFFNRFAGMARFTPVLPVIGAETRFQPVYADDVAQAAVLGASGRAAPGAYELGGPETMTFRELMAMMLDVIERRRAIVDVPFWVARIIASVCGVVETVTFGLVTAPVTKDQVQDLRHDNVVAAGARGFDALGIQPAALYPVIASYLWRFRPSGQYQAIKASARNLRL